MVLDMNNAFVLDGQMVINLGAILATIPVKLSANTVVGVAGPFLLCRRSTVNGKRIQLYNHALFIEFIYALWLYSLVLSSLIFFVGCLLVESSFAIEVKQSYIHFLSIDNCS